MEYLFLHISKKNMNKEKNDYFIYVLLLLIIISMSVAYYKYMIKENINFFTTEESVPNRFDINSYKQ